MDCEPHVLSVPSHHELESSVAVPIMILDSRQWATEKVFDIRDDIQFTDSPVTELSTNREPLDERPTLRDRREPERRQRAKSECSEPLRRISSRTRDRYVLVERQRGCALSTGWRCDPVRGLGSAVLSG